MLFRFRSSALFAIGVSASGIFATSALAADQAVTFSATASTKLEANEQARKNVASRYQGTGRTVIGIELVGCEETGSGASYNAWKCVVTAYVR
jgi:hypothetical protein